MEHTDFSSNSSSVKILEICLYIAGLCTSNNSDIAFTFNYTSSFCNTTSIFVFPSSSV